MALLRKLGEKLGFIVDAEVEGPSDGARFAGDVAPFAATLTAP